MAEPGNGNAIGVDAFYAAVELEQAAHVAEWRLKLGPALAWLAARLHEPAARPVVLVTVRERPLSHARSADPRRAA